MPYHTLDDLKKDMDERELIQITDDEGLGAVNEANHASACDDAGALIDGYLIGGGYNIPLDPVPALIKKVSKDITIYYLYQRRRRAAMPESVERQYTNSLKILAQVQQGTIKLGVAEEAAGEAGMGGLRTKTSGKMFPDSVLETM